MEYRREIDGLRAIAVIPVVLYHSGSGIFQGGFVGVDVFFVISGYLITRIIVSELEDRDFSLLRFYERRARRILPALVLVSLACIPFAAMWMLPNQLRDFTESILAVFLFSSNLLFWSEGGYFSAASDLKPLLHTWSLAVEEQFYLLFPVFLMLIWKLGRKKVFFGLLLCAAISFAVAEWASRNSPSANFYLAPTRAWELLAGALCVFLKPNVGKPLGSMLSIAGLLAISAAIIFYDTNTPFPSIYAALPVLGTVSIILFAQNGAVVQRILSHRAFVIIGLTSYSTYLWHHPLFAFARIRSATEPDQLVMYGLAAAAFGLGFATWKWIEQPFRKRRRSEAYNHRTVFVLSLSSMVGVLVLAFSSFNYKTWQWKGSGSPSALTIEERVAVNFGLHGDCEHSFTLSQNCRTSERPRVLLWGDSFAMHLAQGLVASRPQIELQQHTLSACSPIIGVAPVGNDLTREWAENCIDFNQNVVDWLSGSEVELVILSSPFAAILESSLLTSDGIIRNGDSFDLVLSSLAETAKTIRDAGARVLIVSPPPMSGWDIGQCAARTTYFNWPVDSCDFMEKYSTRSIQLLEGIQETVPVYWLGKDICSDGLCKPMKDGVILYRDSNHLSLEGSSFLGRAHNWITEFERIAN